MEIIVIIFVVPHNIRQLIALNNRIDVEIERSADKINTIYTSIVLGVRLNVLRLQLQKLRSTCALSDYRGLLEK